MPCAEGVRAVASAAEAESQIRMELYPRSDGLLLRSPETARARDEITERLDARRHRLRIAMLAPPWIPVPPSGYGGIEAVLALLCDALVARGHHVELFCAPGSASSATVRPVLEAAHPDKIGRALFESDHVARAFAAIDSAASIGEPFDVVHDHSGYTALAMADRFSSPLIHTVHGPFDDDSTSFYAHHGAKGTLVCLSQAQAGGAPEGARISAIVPNPIDVSSWPIHEHKDDYLLWVGRIVPEKGPQRAIRIARAAGRPLVLAGPVQPGYERFFSEEIEPHIDGGRVRYVGEVGGIHKKRLFADAYAFLMPICWPEPFGMVMVEALAAGVPVLAFAHGSAPEIIQHGETGFLVDHENEMAAMVDEVAGIDPQRCRSAAIEHYAPERVAALYEAVYLDRTPCGLKARGHDAERLALAA